MSVLSHVLSMREKFKEMQELVQFNLVKAQNYQKKWYDRNARQRQFIPGEFVLVLLSTTTSKFTAQWQGPYQVSKVVGKVNYLVDMDNRKKKKRILHVNMLKKWQVQQSSGYLMKEVEDSEEKEDEEIMTWDGGDDGQPKLGNSFPRIRERNLMCY